MLKPAGLIIIVAAVASAAHSGAQGTPGNSRIGSSRIGSARIGGARIGSARIGIARVDSLGGCMAISRANVPAGSEEKIRRGDSAPTKDGASRESWRG
jgi:hypothetical protein